LRVYCCPECSGTEVTWDRRVGKAVCPKDKTPVSEFRLLVDG
jgi:transcription initiation factor TFIIIB Brf1 subunit/transcription initiation factor TFIIB